MTLKSESLVLHPSAFHRASDKGSVALADIALWRLKEYQIDMCCWAFGSCTGRHRALAIERLSDLPGQYEHLLSCTGRHRALAIESRLTRSRGLPPHRCKAFVASRRLKDVLFVEGGAAAEELQNRSSRTSDGKMGKLDCRDCKRLRLKFQRGVAHKRLQVIE